VVLEKHRYPDPDLGPEYDWYVSFAPPGADMADGRSYQPIVVYRQSIQSGLDYYRMGSEEEVQRFREDFVARTLPLIASVTTVSSIVEKIVNHDFRLIIGDEDDEAFVAAKAMVDVIADTQLPAGVEEVARSTVRAALSKYPALRHDVDRYLTERGVEVAP